MTGAAAPGAATLLGKHRTSIDRLDAILVYTLAERFRHTQEIGDIKAHHDLPSSDPEREAQQITQLKQLAVTAGLDPDFAQKVIRFIIQEVIRHHELHKRKEVADKTATRRP